MFSLIDNIATVTKAGTYYIGDVSFIIEQKNSSLVTKQLALHEDTLFVNMYLTITRCALVIRDNCTGVVSILTNIGITPIENAMKSRFKDDKGLGIEIKLAVGDTVKINDTGFDGIQIQIFTVTGKLTATIPISFKKG